MKTAEELMTEELMADLRASHPLSRGTDNFKWFSWVCRALSSILSELDGIHMAIAAIECEIKRDFGAGKKPGGK